jgi:phage gp29-like protein
MTGVFELLGQLWDAILGDDRVQATFGSRNAGLFGREVRFRPANDSAAAKECNEAWQEDWHRIGTISSLVEVNSTEIGMGFGPAQLVWDSDGPRSIPEIQPWHTRYTYYYWPLKCYAAISQDGLYAIRPGSGKWLLHTPRGAYRGWVRGAIRAIAEPWLIRHFAIRDWARFSEVHGMPIRKAIVPAASAQPDRDRFQAQLTKLGAETTVMVSKGVDGLGLDYDLELIEAKDRAWESFPGLRDHCDMSIVLAIMSQNLTTEVSGGAFAASSTAMDVLNNIFASDNLGWRETIRYQIARPYALLNFGDPDLAPWTDWDVTPRADFAKNAAALQAFGTAVQAMASGGATFTDEAEVREFAHKQLGLAGLPKMKLTDPVEVAAKAAASDHKDKPGRSLK